MLTVYAAWTEGAVEADITTIREAMNCADGDGARHKTARDPARDRSADVDNDWTDCLTFGQSVASTSIRTRKGRVPGQKAIWQRIWQ